MHCAATADIGSHDREIEVGEPVACRFATTERDHDFLVGRINGYVACHICDDGAVFLLAGCKSAFPISGLQAHFSNSMLVVVVACSTRGQFPAVQETLSPGELLFETQ